MKLIRCYVSSFGKLCDFTYDFNDKLNTIKQDNGWGKSTLATFIKAMFYGINSSKRSIAENERIKYKTWNSTQMFGGNVEFEWGGKQFKLERYFGSKESEDTVRLFDALTGKEYPNTENLGKRIFEIDEEGFLSTTYFSQKDFQAKSNSSLTAKFNSVCEIQDTQAFDKALEKLQEKSKHYKVRGDKGIIADTKREINQLEGQIQSALSSRAVIKTLKTEISELEENAEKLKGESTALTDKINQYSKAQVLDVKKEQYEGLVKQIKENQTIIEDADKILLGQTPSDDELNAFSQCYNDLLTVKGAKNSADKEVERLSTLCNSNSQYKTSNMSKIFAVIAVIFAIAGVAGLFIELVAGIIGLVLGVLCGVLTFVLNVKKPQVNPYVVMLEEQKKAQQENDKIHGEYMDKLNSYLSRYNLPKELDMLGAFKTVQENVYQKRNAIDAVGKLNEQLKDFEQIVGQFNKESVKEEDAYALRNQLKVVQEEYSKIANVLASKKASLRMHEQTDETLSDLENKKVEACAKLEQYEKDYKTLLLTIEYLEKADENLKIKYRAPLQNSLNKYLKHIDSVSNANIDVDLNVTVNEPSGQKDTDYYSKGYQNLFEICKRFALTDVLFTGEKPFIILDDPFYNLDDNKLKNAIELIKKLSEEYQILYLVCHESRMA